MKRWSTLITDHGFANVDRERKILVETGSEVEVAQCKTPEQVLAAAVDADALLVQWAPINAEIISALKNCKVIVRYGIGVDNVDLVAAKMRGIPVCNVPDYCVDEVADHTMALALALARQLPQIDRRLRSGVWKITPDNAMPAFSEMTFATAGFGRIARGVLHRASVFGFKLAAFDPFVSEEAFQTAKVAKREMNDLFQEADILSLHLPLTPETRHLINPGNLRRMKKNSVIINTARGGLIDGIALAEALRSKTIAGAGLDVFEDEPLSPDHPLRDCQNALLTSHVAWFSESSVPKLQQLAALEVKRALLGQPLQNQVNK